MYNIWKMGVLFLMVLVLFGCEKKEKELDAKYIAQVPEVLVGESEIEVYTKDNCAGIEDPSPVNPCPEISQDEFLKDKPSSTFEKGAALKIRSVLPPEGMPDKDTPKEEIRRHETFLFFKDGVSILTPTAATQVTYETTKTKVIKKLTIPEEPGHYVGVISRSSRSDEVDYVFQFDVK